MSKQVTMEQVLEKVIFSEESKGLLRRIKPFMGGEPKCSSLHATYLITSLYSEFGSDQANLERICSNLQMAAADLEMISSLLRSMV
jgi:hypothetical protein